MKLVLTTFGNAEDAARVIRTLVEERLAVCGTIMPGARSIYHWAGKIEDASETVVLLKTADGRADELAERLGALHPFSNPEIVTFAPAKVAPAYAEWVEENCAR